MEQPNDSLYRAIVDTAVDAIIVIDRFGRIRSVNKAAEELFGYAIAEIAGRNIAMLMPEPYGGEHDSYLAHYRRTSEKRIIGIGREVSGRRRDGTVFPMELSVGEARQGDEQIFVGIVRDITDRKAAELALRERELRLRSMLDTIPDGVIVTDSAGLILSFSSSAERLFGYAADEMIGRNVKMLLPPPYHGTYDDYLERYLRTGERRIIGTGRIAAGLRKNGDTFPMELSVGEFMIGDDRLFTGFVRDLTERQQTEKRLHDLQSELLHVSRLSAMGQMASTLAHELNQPLTAISNYLQGARRMLANARGNPVPAQFDSVIEKAVAQAARAGEVIRRLRAFVATGEAEKSVEPLSKVVEEATALALVGAKEHLIQTRFALDDDVPPVLIDKIQIQQVVLNLVRNAVEALGECKRREIVIGVRAPAGEGLAEVTISDSGPGIAADIAERLFQPFVTTKSSGMGLGLSICREIIEMHGGHLTAAPNPGGGTIFRFTLPFANEEPDHAA